MTPPADPYPPSTDARQRAPRHPLSGELFEALLDSLLPTHERLLLMALVVREPAMKGRIVPIDALCRDSALSESTVKSTLNALWLRDLLDIQHRFGPKNEPLPSRYTPSLTPLLKTPHSTWWDPKVLCDFRALCAAYEEAHDLALSAQTPKTKPPKRSKHAPRTWHLHCTMQSQQGLALWDMARWRFEKSQSPEQAVKHLCARYRRHAVEPGTHPPQTPVLPGACLRWCLDDAEQQRSRRR